MKKLAKLYITVVLLFVALFVVSNVLFNRIQKKNIDNTNILMNRVVENLEEEYGVQNNTTSSKSESAIQKIIDDYMNKNGKTLAKEYGASSIPDKVIFIPVQSERSSVALINKDDSSDKVWTFYGQDSVIGFVVFEYKNDVASDIRMVINICLAVAFIIALGICIYISRTVLHPFEKLSDYPEKLSKNEITEKLPETKNRIFGKFIWGINMLSDNIQNKQRRVDELSRDHMTMLTTIAHGIKTPVANIKLYADAISTGLYQENGEINKSDAEIAGKISKNADDITDIVKDLIDKASDTVVVFEPDIQTFYLKELIDFLEEEYSNRLNVLDIPYTFDMNHNAIVKSDKSGICRILSQLMDNAIKYGNGDGISVNLSKEEDGFYFVVKNKGSVLGENEMAYIFNSFWRGSNADKTNGSGIGLFEARTIAQNLDGDIYVKGDREASEMEFDVYIPL